MRSLRTSFPCSELLENYSSHASSKFVFTRLFPDKNNIWRLLNVSSVVSRCLPPSIKHSIEAD